MSHLWFILSVQIRFLIELNNMYVAGNCGNQAFPEMPPITGASFSNFLTGASLPYPCPGKMIRQSMTCLYHRLRKLFLTKIYSLRSPMCVCESDSVCVWVIVCVRVCVCEREREKERERDSVCAWFDKPSKFYKILRVLLVLFIFPEMKCCKINSI